ncbi:helix-turn-helix domain-containing protein [Ruminococcus sp. CLA-AA-H200]|uniref:Helix-turn-helix domain-containing protein n=1 Tax=Ruminococcus turbiniformis TaxID=2881258 RepID=A0ABS8G085_9FIRM|nr:helix-turn-helix transcriptional regulator [Ruminococcus turbiniformis]MCC2255700.1 helix-turn-helix domain-containing protein [Ruminococcus turbiniformis]
MEQKLKQDIQIGETIRSLRMERKLTQDQVVSKLQLMDLDITRSIYSQIEGGTYSIRISVLSGLSRIFQVDYNTFFRDVHLPASE